MEAGDYITRPVLMQMTIEGNRGDTVRIRRRLRNTRAVRFAPICDAASTLVKANL